MTNMHCGLPSERRCRLLDLQTVQLFLSFTLTRDLNQKMYQRGYNQGYDQYGSYNQYESQHSGFDSRSSGPSYGSAVHYESSRPAAPRIVFDDYNSDLNFVIEADGVTGSSLHKDGFEYMWGGARATHGVRSGKV